jgi:hypothetical protein
MLELLGVRFIESTDVLQLIGLFFEIDQTHVRIELL